ncbi:hypothetical protein TSAR_008049 [Trichomalopsis sarcophagae]|uniref:Uncharacterized protein n=1 Tax=Trichomalopsis sarcophagae TaxID=543379 RepID=A0A232EMA4_9HYME|nr:hypothetical protein TSAR_008049 [Trichomalopsis sarcophagae]
MTLMSSSEHAEMFPVLRYIAFIVNSVHTSPAQKEEFTSQKPLNKPGVKFRTLQQSRKGNCPVAEDAERKGSLAVKTGGTLVAARGRLYARAVLHPKEFEMPRW